MSKFYVIEGTVVCYMWKAFPRTLHSSLLLSIFHNLQDDLLRQICFVRTLFGHGVSKIVGNPMQTCTYRVHGKRFNNIYVQNIYFPPPTKFFDLVWRSFIF
jgi:hypothetical protein